MPMTMEEGVPRRLVGKVALVTGAGGAIGRASALRLAREGASVGIADVRLAAAEESVAVLEADGLTGYALECDVRHEESVNSMVHECVAQFGRIDLLHNNAGVLIPGTALTQTLDDWDLHFAVNVRGMLLVSRAVIPHMQRQGGGAIVNTGSTASLVGEPNLVAYDSTKGAVIQLTRQMAIDFAKDGIRVNCVCPGWIDTGFNDPIFDEAGMTPEDIDESVKQAIPMNRQGTADDIAPSVAFLCSDDASYITGTSLVIDGGFVAQ
jgi:meso-butanediol dehydrogenase / (S,S)-butanediol dehydrogenase / diacetyl reductase